MEILVVGSLNMDFRIGVDHLVSMGETESSKHFELVPGGKGANQAYAAGRLGNKTTMLGAVGKDSYGASLMKNLEKANVSTSHIAVREGIESGIAIVEVDDEGNNAILVIPGANATVDKAYIDQNLEVLKQCDLVLLQMEIPVETVLYVAKIAKGMGKTVVLDPAPVPSCMPSEIFQYIDFIKPNENELRMLTGTNDIAVGMRNLLNYGVGCVIVTVGKEGAKVLSRIEDSVVTYLTPDVSIVDTTAAGDSFVAAFATAYLKDKDIANAVDYANKVGAFVVTRKGAQSSIPNQGEMEKFCEELELSK